MKSKGQKLLLDTMERVPQAMLSRGWGKLARMRFPRSAVQLLKKTFVEAVGIDMSEAAYPLSHYKSLEDLFVRELRAGARRVDPHPKAVVSPVDGTIGACGIVNKGMAFQVKGREYAIARLLHDLDAAVEFDGGAYATIYLSPKDYHRVHAPVAGSVVKSCVVPGRLRPVFPAYVEHVEDLFVRNERLITYIQTPEAGLVAVVKVGATLVGRISVSYDSELITNVAGVSETQTKTYDPAILMAKGGLVGKFEMGSTVVLLAQEGRIDLDDLVQGESIRMGERIGSLVD